MQMFHSICMYSSSSNKKGVFFSRVLLAFEFRLFHGSLGDEEAVHEHGVRRGGVGRRVAERLGLEIRWLRRPLRQVRVSFTDSLHLDWQLMLVSLFAP